MKERVPTPAQIVAAKRLASGPLGKLFGRFPCQFTKPLVMGDLRLPGNPVNSATVTLVDLGAGPLALTCSHVIKKFRELRVSNPSVLIQIGELAFDPTCRLRPTSDNADLAAIDLTGLDIERITKGEEIGGFFHKPPTWPPQQVQEGDYVTISGFPAHLRKSIQPTALSFGAISIATCPVASVTDDHFAIQFERQHWVTNFNYEGFPVDQMWDFCGVSGAPMFLERRSEVGISLFSLVGIVYEYASLDILLAVPSGFLEIDGTVRESSRR